MKKIFLLLAFAGIVGASSANTFTTSNKSVTSTFKQDEKKKKDCCKKDKNHDCSKHEKGKCTMSDSTKHDCSKHEKGKCHSDSTKSCKKEPKGKKDCCKHGATPAVPPAK